MTREEAIKQLEDLREHCSAMINNTCIGGENIWRKDVEALNMAIKALEQEQKLTRMIDKSDFSQEQYSTDIQSAYDCGKSVLDKIRAEIEALIEWHDCPIEYDNGNDAWYCEACNQAIKIIDKYKTESEDKNEM